MYTSDMPLAITPVTVKTPVAREHVAATTAGLSGHYTNTDLYNRYLSVCEEADATPGSPDAFARHLSPLGHTPWRTATHRGWLVTPQPYPDAP